MVSSFADVRAALRGHLPVLDGVRGLAILLVLAHNAAGPEGPRAGWALATFDVATNIGWIGVQLFFVLSGFLITGILLDTRDAPNALGAFYMRRVVRIFPLYYAALVFAFVVFPLFGVVAKAQPHAIAYVLYLQNWSRAIVEGDGAGKLVHFWSLAVEEQFYLVWPALVLTLPRRAFGWVAFGLVVAALGVRATTLASHASAEWAYQATFARMDALAMGGLAALLVRSERAYTRWAPRLGVAIAVLGATMLALVVDTRGFARLQPVAETVGFTILGLFFTAIVLAGVCGVARRSWLARALEARPLALLGKYSYGLYVLHVPIVTSLHEGLGVDLGAGTTLRRIGARVAFATVSLGASLVAAVISFHLFEKRFLDLKRHFVARQAHDLAAPRAA